MLSNKNRTKVRFHSTGFQKRLQEARGYKRNSRTTPQTGSEVFFSKVGLSSWVSKLLTVLSFVLLVYIVYIPNGLFVKKVEVRGVDEAAKAGIETTVNNFLDKKLPWPQKNLLLLSKKNLSQYLVKNNKQVLEVVKIDKDFPNTLIVEITQRVDEFVLETGPFTYILANDGTVASKYFATSTPEGFEKIIIQEESVLDVGQAALPKEAVNFIHGLKRLLPDISKSNIAVYQLADFESPDLTVTLQNGFKVIFDVHSNPEETLNRLKLLLARFDEQGIKRIYYADMRFENKSYVCNKASACVREINLLPSAPATSTIETLTN